MLGRLSCQLFILAFVAVKLNSLESELGARVAIAIISDHQSEPTQLLPVIRDICAETFVCESLPSLTDLANTCQINLILFCFDDVRQAENFMSEMVNSEIFSDSVTPGCLLLCKGADARRASELCRDRLFTDFSIIRPLQDIHQFEWFVRRHFNSHHPDYQHEVDKLLKVVWQKLKNLKTALSEIEQLPPRIRYETKKIISELSTEFSQLNQVVDEQLSYEGERTFVTSLERLPNRIFSTVNDFQKAFLKRGISQIESITNDVLQVENRLFSANKRKILIVDDNYDFRVLIREVLEDNGYEVISASDASVAITQICRSQPDLVLIDYDMPQVNGLQMLERLAGMNISQRLPPLIMMTGHSQSELVHRSAEVGIVDFIVKPVRTATLLSKVNKHMSREDD